MKVVVQHVKGSRRGQRQEFDAPERIRFGRHPDSEVSFDAHRDLDASSRHAELVRAGERFLLRDVGSSNGTYVAGERITDAVAIALEVPTEVDFGAGGPRVRILVAQGAVESDAAARGGGGAATDGAATGGAATGGAATGGAATGGATTGGTAVDTPVTVIRDIGTGRRRRTLMVVAILVAAAAVAAALAWAATHRNRGGAAGPARTGAARGAVRPEIMVSHFVHRSGGCAKLVPRPRGPARRRNRPAHRLSG